MKKDGIYVFKTEYNIYKNYFIEPPVTKITENNIKMTLCSKDKLEKLLVSKYGLVKLKIQNKLNYLENYINYI